MGTNDVYVLSVSGHPKCCAAQDELEAVLRAVAAPGTQVESTLPDYCGGPLKRSFESCRLKLVFEMRTLGAENVHRVHEVCNFFFTAPFSWATVLITESSEDVSSDDPSCSEEGEGRTKSPVKKRRRTHGSRRAALQCSVCVAPQSASNLE
jgi:hypothetical protein